jgi:hypothetical protein
MAAETLPLGRIGRTWCRRSRNLEDRSADWARGRAKLSLKRRRKVKLKRRLERHSWTVTSSSCKRRPLGKLQAVAGVRAASTTTGRRPPTSNVLASDVVLAGTSSGRSRINLVLGVILLASMGAVKEATLSTVLAWVAAGRSRRLTTLLTRTTTTGLLPSLRTRAAVVAVVRVSRGPILGAMADIAASVDERTGRRSIGLTLGREAHVRSRRTRRRPSSETVGLGSRVAIRRTCSTSRSR